MLGSWLAKRKTRAAFDALNRHDLEALVRNYADDVIFVYPGEVGPHGRHEGMLAVRTLLERIFRQFPHIRFKVKHVAVAHDFDILGSNVVYTHWDVDLKNHEGIAARFSGVTVATVRQGKVVLLEASLMRARRATAVLGLYQLPRRHERQDWPAAQQGAVAANGPRRSCFVSLVVSTLLRGTRSRSIAADR